ncbi:MAG: MFS transporter [Leptospirales bacterium]|nr:MFS transporter [Leptospirales bacterium]
MTRSWQWTVAAALTAGYAGFYFCRSNFAVAEGLMSAEFGQSGISQSQIGWIASLGIAFYFVGKFLSGIVADFLGGRAVFFLAMALSVFFTVLGGVAATPLVFAVFWSANRLVQSAGWPSLVKIASRSFAHSWQGSALGFISVSYLAGDAIARAYFGSLIAGGMGWRGIFFSAAIALAIIAALCALAILPAPEMTLEEQGELAEEHLFGHHHGEHQGVRAVLAHLRPYMLSPRFWLVAAMSFALTFVRETFNFWSVALLRDVGGLDQASAVLGSAIFPAAGALSTIGAGLLSDHLARRRRVLIILPGIALGATTLLALYWGGAALPLWSLLLFTALSALFLIGPYSLLSGAMAVDLGGRHGSSTAAGLIDGIGYVGALFSGWGVAMLAAHSGWQSVFGLLAGACVMAFLAALSYYLLRRHGS